MRDTLDLGRRALAMDFATVADILTWTDEPDLIRQPGEPIPVYSAADIAAARLANAWIAAQMATGEGRGLQ